MVDKVVVRCESLRGDDLEQMCELGGVEIPSLEELQRFGVYGAVAEAVKNKYGINNMEVQKYAKQVLKGTTYERKFD